MPPSASATDESKGANARPVYCDLDGTLVRTDMLYETILHLCRKQPFRLFVDLLTQFRNPEKLKRSLAQRFIPDPKTLPYRESVLEYLAEQKSAGRPIILATASDRAVAEKVAGHLGVFDDIIASDNESNYKSEAKLKAIRDHCGSHGWEEFEYIGDSNADVSIFAACQDYNVAAPSASLLRRLKPLAAPRRVFDDSPNIMRHVIKLIRPHQWAKNALVAIPLITSQHWNKLGSVMDIIIAVTCFSAIASSGYVVNDLLDIEADRSHEDKRRRVFAASLIDLRFGPVICLVLAGLGFAGALLLLNPMFAAILVVYLALSLAYSFLLKSKLAVDVITLSGLYTIRIIAGCAAIQVPPSEWLLTFSVFLFVSLAFVKRFTELHMNEGLGSVTLSARGYYLADLMVILGSGISSGYLACLTFALYISSESVNALYPRPEVLWLLIPLLMYWITRLWFLAIRRELHHDPVVFVMTDWRSILTLVLAGAIFIGASL